MRVQTLVQMIKETVWVNLSIITMASLVVGCAAAGDSISTQCVVNADQAANFMGHWTAHPIPLGAIANDFSDSELQAIDSAIKTWNTFFTASKGYSLYLQGSAEFKVVSSATRYTESTICGETIVGPNGFTNSIMIVKDKTTWGYSSDIIALTSSCPIVIASSAYKEFVSSVMELNYQNFFNAGQEIPDLQSIVTHELGHVLGLNHSCIGDACNNAPADYSAAIMYPTLGFNGTSGIIKTGLTQNDEERANCLY